jgi:hypothetical protein
MMQTTVTNEAARPRGAQRRARPSALAMHARGATTRENSVRNVNKRAEALGWFSIALGLSQILAPSGMARLVGTRDDERTRKTMLAVGLREITAGIGILTQDRPKGWLWARVAGDAMDLAMLGRAFTTPRNRRGNLAFSTAAVIGVMSLDWLTARDMDPGRDAGAQAEQKRVKSTVAITVSRGLEEVARGWRNYEEQHQTNLDVQFAAAPGGRGTELRVQHGTLGGLPARNELRHFKQVIETGEIVHSDASVHRGPHTARPSKLNGEKVQR